MLLLCIILWPALTLALYVGHNALTARHIRYVLLNFYSMTCLMKQTSCALRQIPGQIFQLLIGFSSCFIAFYSGFIYIYTLYQSTVITEVISILITIHFSIWYQLRILTCTINPEMCMWTQDIKTNRHSCISGIIGVTINITIYVYIFIISILSGYNFKFNDYWWHLWHNLYRDM